MSKEFVCDCDNMDPVISYVLTEGYVGGTPADSESQLGKRFLLDSVSGENFFLVEIKDLQKGELGDPIKTKLGNGKFIVDRDFCQKMASQFVSLVEKAKEVPELWKNGVYVETYLYKSPIANAQGQHIVVEYKNGIFVDLDGCECPRTECEMWELDEEDWKVRVSYLESCVKTYEDALSDSGEWADIGMTDEQVLANGVEPRNPLLESMNLSDESEWNGVHYIFTEDEGCDKPQCGKCAGYTETLEDGSQLCPKLGVICSVLNGHWSRIS